MNIKEMLKKIYENNNYGIKNGGFTNDGKIITYRNAKIISFIQFITRKSRYGPKSAEDYIKDGYFEVVFTTETLLNDEIENIEKVKNIDEALEKLLNTQSSWGLCWIENDIFKYTIEQLYNNQPLDAKKWGW